MNKILLGNCQDVLCDVPDKTFNLIVTSPPYADARKKPKKTKKTAEKTETVLDTVGDSPSPEWNGAIKPDEYVKWFLPKSKEFFRTLADDGTFILNIKENVVNGQRHTYVIDLIKELQSQGWLWTEEFVWCKKNCTPGKWPNRFRDAWERLLQFNKQRKFSMYQDAVMVPMGDWAKQRLKKLGENDVVRFKSQAGSKFGKNIANWVGRDKAYPTNVLKLATECSNKHHSATFPQSLPEWFIKLFTKENDIVLDPFVGSGTTCLAAIELKRQYTGIELDEGYYKVAIERLESAVKKTTR